MDKEVAEERGLGLLSMDEVVAELKLNRRTVDRMIEDGRLPAWRLAGVDRVYVRRQDILDRLTPVEPKKANKD